MSNPFNSPALPEKRGYWACWTDGVKSATRGRWRALPVCSARPFSRKEHKFVGPFKTLEMAWGYADEQNAAAAKEVRG